MITHSTEVCLEVLLVACETSEATDIMSEASTIEDFLVDVHVGKRGGGLFGKMEAGRVLLQGVLVSSVLRAAASNNSGENWYISAFLEHMKPLPELPASPLPASELLPLVFKTPSPDSDRTGREEALSADQSDVTAFVLHMLRRIRKSEAVKDDFKAEWDILEKELRRRRFARIEKALRSELHRHMIQLEAVVESVSDRGDFTLRFKRFDSDEVKAIVPPDFTGMSSASDANSEERASEGLFGQNTRPGLFGTVGNPRNSGGGLFG
eukprot:gnl/MRDRNA2_/MRDRNA2_18620_c0_seq1.p1 gnl/MRDRNA2_/MRDRNA2_18620_c0~~gnl/MRDRNA2_/MRDRNA2_18620_c0_seq1.p1  ORF type:complete len:266 (+),score=44.64 gnl/MRDRNA2_/MRDRNA2_18620_c0_seq1:44-841(+)